MQDEVKLSQEIVKIESFSGYNPEAINFVANFLKKLDFECDFLTFEEENSYKVNNLHAVYNPHKSDKVFYFAGHTDVVATGDLNSWKHNPFSATIEGDYLYGRGTSDMKCAIACFMQATKEFLTQNPEPEFGIGFLITNDEEAKSINGTKKVLNWMVKNNHKISSCLVGEPTNPNKLGQMAKVGRRGSINFELEIIGKQGHVAYAEKALNPITCLIDILKMVNDHTFDDGNEFFVPTNLEITNIQSDNLGDNVIAEKANANFNVRFNSNHNSSNILQIIEFACKQNCGAIGYKYNLKHRVSGESFLTKERSLACLVKKVASEKTGEKTELTTTGGTSDARFIKDYCQDLVEFGLINKTSHQIDEYSKISEIKQLKEIYFAILNQYQNLN